MSRKFLNPSIVNYPDSDEEFSSRHVVRKNDDSLLSASSKYSTPQQPHTKYKGNTGQYNRFAESRQKNSNFQGNFSKTKKKNYNDLSKPEHITSKEEMVNFVFNLQQQDLRQDRKSIDSTPKPNNYRSAEANWKKYKSEKAAEIVNPEQFKSAEAGWKKIKSENMWSTSAWKGISSRQTDEEQELNKSGSSDKFYDMFADNISNEPTQKDKSFWSRYSDTIDDNSNSNQLEMHSDDKRIVEISKPRFNSEKDEEFLFDEILSRSIDDQHEGDDPRRDMETNAYDSEDSLYEKEILKSKKLLEETQRVFNLSDEWNYEDFERDGKPRAESDIMNHMGEDKRNRYNEMGFEYEYDDVKEVEKDHLHSTELYDYREKNRERKIEEHDKKIFDFPGGSESPEGENESHFVQQNEGRHKEDDGQWFRSVILNVKDKDKSFTKSPKRRHSSSSSRSSSAESCKSKVESGSARSQSQDENSGEPETSTQVVANPYDNPDLNVTTIDKYFDDLMEWNYSHRCLICDKIFLDFKQWTTHILDTKHGKEFHLDPYRCPPCHEIFRHKKEWKLHMAYSSTHGFMGSINVQKPGTLVPIDPRYPVQHGWRCKGCNAITQNRSDAYKHIKMVHLIHQALYPCPLCGIPFWSQVDLDTHADEVHAPPKYTCKLCHRSFESEEKLKTHRLIKHQRKIFCYKCKTDIDELIYDEHTEMHRLKRMVSCKYCGGLFSNNSLLQKHLKFERCDRHKKYRKYGSRDDFDSGSDSSENSSGSESSPRDRRIERKRKNDRYINRTKSKSQSSKEFDIDIQDANLDSKTRDAEGKFMSSECASPGAQSESDIAPPGDEDYQPPPNRLKSDVEVKAANNAEKIKTDPSKYCREDKPASSMEKRSFTEDRNSRSFSHNRRNSSGYRRSHSRDHGSNSRKNHSKSHDRSRSHSRDRSASYRSRRSRSHDRNRSHSRDHGTSHRSRHSKSRDRSYSGSHDRSTSYRTGESRTRDRSRHYKSRRSSKSRSRSQSRDCHNYDSSSTKYNRKSKTRYCRDSRKSSISERSRSKSPAQHSDTTEWKEIRMDSKPAAENIEYVNESQTKNPNRDDVDIFENNFIVKSELQINETYDSKIVKNEDSETSINNTIDMTSLKNQSVTESSINVFEDSVLQSQNDHLENVFEQKEDFVLDDNKVIQNATWVVESQQNKQNSDSESEDDKDSQKINCKECGRTFKTLTNLRDHFMVKHRRNFSLKSKKPQSTNVPSKQINVRKKPAVVLTEEQKEIAKLIEGIE